MQGSLLGGFGGMAAGGVFLGARALPDRPMHRPGVVIRGTPDFPHEGPQAVRMGEFLGGGEFEFLGNNAHGIEGFFRPAGNPTRRIPISLKSWGATQRLGSILREIRRASNAIREAGQEGATLYAEPTGFAADDVADFARNGPIYPAVPGSW